MSESDQERYLYIRSAMYCAWGLCGAVAGFKLSRQLPNWAIWLLLVVWAVDAVTSVVMLVLRALSVRYQKKTQALIEYLGSEKWAREVADAVVAQKLAEMASAGQPERVERQGGWA